MVDQAPLPTNTLQSFPNGFSACIWGASGGIGGAFAKALMRHVHIGRIFLGSRSGGEDIDPRIVPFQFDLEDEGSIARASAMMREAGPLHLNIVATGILSDATLKPEKSFAMQSPEAFARAFAINTIGPALIAKHILPLFPRGERAVFAALSARVASISDNRLGGWHAYRASKAALNMLIRNYAIELGRTHPLAVVASLHPGTVDTALSKPFQGNVAEGKLFTPDHSATALLGVIDGLSPADSGGLFAWDGQRIPF